MADAGILQAAECGGEAEFAGRAQRLVWRARILGGSFFLNQVLILTSVLTVIAFIATFLFCILLAGTFRDKVMAEHQGLEGESRAWAQELSRAVGVPLFEGVDGKTIVDVYVALRFVQVSQPHIRAVLLFGLCLFLVFGLLRSYVMDSPEELRPQESGKEALRKELDGLSAHLPEGLRVVLASGGETCCHRGTVYISLRHFVLYTRKDPEAGLFVIRHEVFHHLAGDSVILWASRLLSHFLTFLLTALLVLFVAMLIPVFPGYLGAVPPLLLLAVGYFLYRRLLGPYHAFATYHELLADDYAVVTGQARGLGAISSERCSAPSEVHLSADERLDYQTTGATRLPGRALAYLHVLWITTFCFPASLGLSTFTPPWMTVAAIAVTLPLLLAVIRTPRPKGLEPASVLAVLLAVILLTVLLFPVLWHGHMPSGLDPSMLATMTYALYTVVTYGLTLRK